MSVGALDHLGRHAEVASRLPDRHAALHKPRCSGVPQRMWDDAAPQPSKRHGVPESRLDRFDGRPLPLNEMRGDDAAPDPTPHMGQEPRRYRSRRLPLVRRAAAYRQPIVDALFKVDERMADISVRRGRRDRAGASTGIQPNQDESGQMPQWPLVCGDLLAA